ncbi:MAG: prolipoprotein diacylglyceryl transferase, partial [Clostridia bacterium]|nr:prolipoprotein diacylglyceryl transferase [Clostridia bacterium]
IIGGLIAAFITCKLEKLNFYNLLDCAGMSLLIGQGIGRWGNYANQEAFGVFTNGNYGMMSDKVISYIEAHPELYGLEGVSDIPGYIEENNLFVHPTFFYEFAWCMLGVLVLYIITCKFRKFSGQTFLCYGIWYGLERAVVEGLRTDSLYIGNTGLRVSQVLSVLIVVVCLVVLVVKLIKIRKKPVLIEGVDYFPADEKQVKKTKKKTLVKEEKESKDFAKEDKKDE